MADSATTIAATAGAAAGTLGALWPHPEIDLLSGIFCGALVFLLRSKEPSWIKKVVYFGVSLIGGYAVTPSFHAALPWLPTWLAAFVSASGVLAATIIVLEQGEIEIRKIMARWGDRISGGGRDE